MMKWILLIAMFTLSFSAVAAEQYVCTKGSAERVIEVVYKSLDGKVPCEVKYTKPNKAATVLWRASKEAGYCEAKAKAFAQKQVGFGWTCAGL